MCVGVGVGVCVCVCVGVCVCRCVCVCVCDVVTNRNGNPIHLQCVGRKKAESEI